MDKVRRVMELREVVAEAEYTIKHSYSDSAIERAYQALEIFTEKLEDLEASLNDDERGELELFDYDLRMGEGG